ncbi:MAG: hypothetical protein ABW033_02480 [Acidimicrobiia bacterium]
MRYDRLAARRLAAITALAAAITLVSALAAPAIDAHGRASETTGAAGRRSSDRDAAHSGARGARTTDRAQPGAAVLPLLTFALALAFVASLRFFGRRRFGAAAWSLQWSRGPPAAAFAVSFA